MDSIEWLATILKGEARRWEDVIFRWACDLARKAAEYLLQRIDQDLMKGREGGLRMEGLRQRWVTTLFGDIRISRRLYKDSKGDSRFLLDEAMGLRKRSQASPKVEELATFLSTRLPFGKCEQLLRALLPDGLSYTTIHRLVGRTVDPYIQEEEREVAELLEDGVLPESENKAVPYLMIEAELDRFHLPRAIYEGAGSDMAGEVYRACTAGDPDRADEILRQAEEKAEAGEAARLRQLRGYLSSNTAGLRDYRLVTGYRQQSRGHTRTAPGSRY